MAPLAVMNCGSVAPASLTHPFLAVPMFGADYCHEWREGTLEVLSSAPQFEHLLVPDIRKNQNETLVVHQRKCHLVAVADDAKWYFAAQERHGYTLTCSSHCLLLKEPQKNWIVGEMNCHSVV